MNHKYIVKFLSRDNCMGNRWLTLNYCISDFCEENEYKPH